LSRKKWGDGFKKNLCGLRIHIERLPENSQWGLRAVQPTASLEIDGFSIGFMFNPPLQFLLILKSY